MLTDRENFLEVIHGGTPERYCHNFDFMTLVFDTISMNLNPMMEPGDKVQNAWGVWNYLGENEPGPMPLTDDEHKLVTDICDFRNQITVPKLIYTPEEWEPAIAMANAVDRSQKFVAPFLGNGIFEKMHYFMGMEDAMCNLYEEPEASHDLIDFLVDWEIKQGEEIIKYMHPDAIFHHDDFGTQKNSFMAPEMFEEFFVPAYEKLYGFWHENGIEIITHHSDAYGANLMCYFERMGIDVWQGVIDTNPIPQLIEEYGPQCSMMGGLNNGIYDKPETTYEQVRDGLRELLDSCPNNGKNYLCPGLTMGGDWSVFPEVYDLVAKAVEEMNHEFF